MIQAAPSPRARIVATGRYNPPRVVTNHDLESMVETSDEWIRTRTGIRERRLADAGTHAADMGAAAARVAMERAGITAEDVDILLVSTATPDRLLPSTACDIQALLGTRNAAAYDYASACSGFLYGLSLAEAHIAAGQAKTVLLICTEKMSSIIDWTDRATCVL
ncbi:MAG TPA: 3-oxoacyl-ACP synthase, partial [Longimicrobium sp.]|nr:3-oxoacyl-ACP synthase [Longimicrobium sp.]